MAAKRPARSRAPSPSAATRKSSAKTPVRARPKVRTAGPATGKRTLPATRRPAPAKSVKEKVHGAARSPAAKPRASAGRKTPGTTKANVKKSASTTARAIAKKPARGKAAPKTAAGRGASRPVKATKTAKAPSLARPKAAAKKAAPRPAGKPAPKDVSARAMGKGSAAVSRSPHRPAPKGGPGKDDGKTYKRLPHIDDTTLDRIIAKLEEMRNESLAIVNMHVSPETKPMGEEVGVGDDMDLASQDRDREFNLLMHERHLRRLQQVEEAFERIADRTYGLCEGTDEPINPKRLMIMPLARFSIEYQQVQEKMLGRTPEDFFFEEESALEGEEE